jgi:uridylate kinase
MENRIPIIVANIQKEGTLQRIVLEGEPIGTLVHLERE